MQNKVFEYISKGSLEEQERQRELFVKNGYNNWFKELADTSKEHPMFDKIIKEMRSGDELVFTELESIPLPVGKLITWFESCNDQDIRITFINDRIDNETVGRLKDHQENILKNNAKRHFEKQSGGRIKNKLTKEQLEKARSTAYLYDERVKTGEWTMSKLKTEQKYSGMSTMYRHLRIVGIKI